jgi:hypothetical protein
MLGKNMMESEEIVFSKKSIDDKYLINKEKGCRMEQLIQRAKEAIRKAYDMPEEDLLDEFEFELEEQHFNEESEEKKTMSECSSETY